MTPTHEELVTAARKRLEAIERRLENQGDYCLGLNMFVVKRNCPLPSDTPYYLTMWGVHPNKLPTKKLRAMCAMLDAAQFEGSAYIQGVGEKLPMSLSRTTVRVDFPFEYILDISDLKDLLELDLVAE